MPEHIKFGSTTLWTAGDANVLFKAEKDLNGRTHVFEPLGDVNHNIYRGSKRGNRSYTIVCDLVLGGAYTDLQQLRAWWEAAHSAEGGLVVLERETSTGATLYLDCVAEAPQWGAMDNPVSIEVTQEYTAGTPLWYGAEVSTATNFNGAVPVSLACNNLGDVATWIRFLIEDAVEGPKIAYSTEWEIEFDLLTMGAGDELDVHCKTPATAWYTPSGGAAARAYGYSTFASSFRNAKLAVGNHNLTLTAVAGAATCTVYWNPLYEALQ